MVWSGGCDEVITPHATVFARNGAKGTGGKSRLVMGAALSPKILSEDIGRLAMVESVIAARPSAKERFRVLLL